VRLSVQREQGYAVLEVADDGIGIPAEALPHVFKRFFRVDSSRSREQGGAGLGLAIVKSICSAHGGDIEVISTPGRGSTFRLRQPLAVGAQLRA
jgi:signal transduction histidine kinase